MSKNVNLPVIPSSEITPRELYLSRRDWLKAAGLLGASSLLAACGISAGSSGSQSLVDEQNSFAEITNYNNYYEFTFDKEDVNQLSMGFQPTPWSLEVAGLVHNPRTWSLEELLKLEQVERIYRLRCVEAWSMVIPWTGFELNRLIAAADPMSSAKFVQFTTLFDPEQFPGQLSPLLPWPYTEGLRLDEALHPLTLMATGLYGESLPNPNGAPIRLVVPWKYGFKSIKAVVRIELTESQPTTLWTNVLPNEYGFYANVNPQVDHPRWSQRTERRIGELERRDTLMFNGYEEEVASLYTGMDLRVNY